MCQGTTYVCRQCGTSQTALTARCPQRDIDVDPEGQHRIMGPVRRFRQCSICRRREARRMEEQGRIYRRDMCTAKRLLQYLRGEYLSPYSSQNQRRAIDEWQRGARLHPFLGNRLIAHTRTGIVADGIQPERLEMFDRAVRLQREIDEARRRPTRDELRDNRVDFFGLSYDSSGAVHVWIQQRTVLEPNVEPESALDDSDSDDETDEDNALIDDIDILFDRSIITEQQNATDDTPNDEMDSAVHSSEILSENPFLDPLLSFEEFVETIPRDPALSLQMQLAQDVEAYEHYLEQREGSSTALQDFRTLRQQIQENEQTTFDFDPREPIIGCTFREWMNNSERFWSRDDMRWDWPTYVRQYPSFLRCMGTPEVIARFGEVRDIHACDDRRQYSGLPRLNINADEFISLEPSTAPEEDSNMTVGIVARMIEGHPLSYQALMPVLWRLWSFPLSGHFHTVLEEGDVVALGQNLRVAMTTYLSNQAANSERENPHNVEELEELEVEESEESEEEEESTATPTQTPLVDHAEESHRQALRIIDVYLFHQVRFMRQQALRISGNGPTFAVERYLDLVVSDFEEIIDAMGDGHRPTPAQIAWIGYTSDRVADDLDGRLSVDSLDLSGPPADPANPAAELERVRRRVRRRIEERREREQLNQRPRTPDPESFESDKSDTEMEY